jgi:endonuclease YncB( thermonuclease family)
VKKRIATILILSLVTGLSQSAYANDDIRISSVYDGDTVTLSTGAKIRLLQIDTPELSPSECYGQEARLALIRILGEPGKLSLKNDPNLDSVDQFGRLLRYIFKGKTNVNLKMVEIGSAAPYFYRGERGAFSKKLLKAAQDAKRKSLGLWKKCPGTYLSPEFALDTQLTKSPSSSGSASICNPNYKGCIPNSSLDLDCADIKKLGLAIVQVIGKDIYKLDRDGDGIGCDK